MIKINKIFQYFVLVIVVTSWKTASLYPQTISESKEIGKPFIQSYGPIDYNSVPQNFDILQDHRGIIYVANNQGMILEFDGTNWRHILFPNKLSVNSLAMDNNGRIYVGGTKDFGYLKADTSGNLEFTSLLKYLDKNDLDFTNINSIHSTPSGVYFCSLQSLFRLNNHELKVWKSESSFSNTFWINGNLYLYEDQTGLLIMKDDSLKLMSGGKKFAERPILAMLPYSTKSNSLDNRKSNKSVLLGIDEEGLFIFDGNTLVPFDGKANEFVQQNAIKCSTVLNDSTFAIGTKEKGVIIFDNKGNIIQTLDRNSGLPDNIVYSINTGADGGIWVATQQGVAYVNNIRPTFTVFDERSGLLGVILSIPGPIRFKGTLYTSTTAGVFYLDDKRSRFSKVSGLNGAFWNLIEYNNELYALGTSMRIINGNNSSLIKSLGTPLTSAKLSDIHPDIFYICPQTGGLIIFRYEKNEFIEILKIEEIFEVIRTIVENPDGSLWLGDESGGVINVRFSEGFINANIKRYDSKSGIQEGGRTYVYKTSGYPVFVNASGIFKFEESTQRFIPDSKFGNKLANGANGVEFLLEDKRGNIWTSVFENSNYYLYVSHIQTDGTYVLERIPFYEKPVDGIWTIYPEDNGIVWFGGVNGLIRYNVNNPGISNNDFPALIRKVVVNEDSIIFGGFLPKNHKLSNIELTHTNNALRFEYSASYYDHPEKNTYKVYLEGFDKGWSNWTSETRKDYINLPSGNYNFQVEAKNIYGDESSVASYSFAILPPFYFTWWAFLIYGAVFIGLSILVVTTYNKRKTKQLTQRTNELEKIVSVRTAELADRNLELQELSTMKSRFFANISHEFRTPLTLIIGQIENLLPNLRKVQNISRAEMALRKSKQLQRLINQLLDLSKFDAHEMKLRASEQNIVVLLRSQTASFESLADKKQIHLKFESSQEVIPVYYEQDKIEKVMNNLLSNAIKYTPEGGNVLVSVETDHLQNDIEIPASELTGDVKIMVRDSGIGIPKDQLPHIFDRFFQVDSSATREHEGTGIGLALTKELVQIHGGGISIESKEGFGTTFTVLLPLGKSHLKPQQIVKDVTPVSDYIIPDIEEHLIPLENSESNETVLLLNKNENSKIVLIVEDNPDMRTYIRETLVNNYDVIEAVNGEEGYMKALEEIPDLIITDVMMPRMDGYELTNRIRKNQVTSHIPIIMLTAKAAESDKFEGLEVGADVFLTKPFSTKELQLRVRKQIEIREQIQKQFRKETFLVSSKIKVTSIDQMFLKKLHELIEERLEDENFGVDAMASEIGVSKRQLQRKLKALTNCTPQQCISTLRLGRAKQLLEQGAGNVTEVAFNVGYKDVNTFSRAFKEEFNILPSSLISTK